MTLHLTDISVDQSSKAVRPVVLPAPLTGGIYRRSFKRFIDATIVLLAAPFIVPAVLFMAALVAFDGHNPFYSQKRVGLNGRIFKMWKLRSMVPNAEEALQDYLASNPAARAEWHTTQKLKNDPRITKMGRFIRKTSLDELPQLFNVFNGTMSLIGPRPMMVEQQLLYPGTAYYHLRPGISGLWQVSDRNECEFAGRAVYDDQYHRELSLGMDASILAKTFGVVLRGTGY